MKRKLLLIVVIAFVISFSIFDVSYAILRNSTSASWALPVATWNVTLEQQGVNNQLTLVPDSTTDNYSLNVKNLSEVDIKYTIVINNLPDGVEISLDGGNFAIQVNNTITFTDAGTILYSDNNKTKSHTLTFRATQGTTPSSNNEVNINVLAQQTL